MAASAQAAGVARAAADDQPMLEHERVRRSFARRQRPADQALARRGVRDRVQDAVVGVERLAGKEHLRDEPRQPDPAPHREVDVRRPPPATRVGHRIGAGLDGADLDRAGLVGQHARRAVEVRVDRRVVVVVRVDVASGGVRLPHLDHRPADRRAVLVDDFQPQVHELADGLLRPVAGDVGAELGEALGLLVRPGQLRARERAALERQRGIPQPGLPVARHDAQRLRRRIDRSDSIEGHCRHRLTPRLFPVSSTTLRRARRRSLLCVARG